MSGEGGPSPEARGITGGHQGVTGGHQVSQSCARCHTAQTGLRDPRPQGFALRDGLPIVAQPAPLKVAISCPSTELPAGAGRQQRGQEPQLLGSPGLRGRDAIRVPGGQWPRARTDTSAVGEGGAQEVVGGRPQEDAERPG